MQSLMDLLLLVAGLSGLFLGLGMLAALMEKALRVTAQWSKAGGSGETA